MARLLVRMLMLRPGKLFLLRDDAKGSNRTKLGKYETIAPTTV
jgi:hypothetical protein